MKNLLFFSVAFFLLPFTHLARQEVTSVYLGYDKLDLKLDQDKACIKASELKIPEAIQKILAQNTWILKNHYEVVKKFYGVTDEVQILDKQAGIDDVKALRNSNLGLAILDAYYNEKIEIIVKESLSMEYSNHIHDMIDLYNNGELFETAVINYENNNGEKFQFLMFAALDTVMSDSYYKQEHTFTVRTDDKSYAFKRFIPVYTANLNYYLQTIENPCTPNQVIRKPELVMEKLKADYIDH